MKPVKAWAIKTPEGHYLINTEQKKEITKMWAQKFVEITRVEIREINKQKGRK